MQDFKIPIPTVSTGIILDKEGWILKKGDLITSTDGTAQIPSKLSLRQNYPNPFNTQIVIEFSLPIREMVQITIYNIDGQRVRRLILQPYEAGTHQVEWNGIDEHGNTAASGSLGFVSYVNTKREVMVVRETITSRQKVKVLLKPSGSCTA